MKERGELRSFSQLGSGLVTVRPVRLDCVNLSVETNGDSITIYNGRDATSGNKVVKVKALANRSVNFNISRGLRCEKGLYVEASASTADWSLFFEDLECSS